MRVFLNTATGKAFWKWFAEHGVLGSFVFSDKEEKRDGEIRRSKLILGGNWYWFSVTTNTKEKSRRSIAGSGSRIAWLHLK